MEEKELKERMLQESDEFKRLHDEHQLYERKLEELKAKGFLTEDERIQEKELKKKKLVLKDRMYLLMTEYKKSR